jgi:hypothetical protein
MKETDPVSETLCLKELKKMHKVQNNSHVYHHFQGHPILRGNRICPMDIPTSEMNSESLPKWANARRVKQTTLRGTRRPTTIKNVPRLRVTLDAFKR